MNLTIFGDANGAAGAASALESGLTADAFWGAILPFMQVIIVTTLVALGYYIMRKVIHKFSKGKSL